MCFSGRVADMFTQDGFSQLLSEGGLTETVYNTVVKKQFWALWKTRTGPFFSD